MDVAPAAITRWENCALGVVSDDAFSVVVLSFLSKRDVYGFQKTCIYAEFLVTLARQSVRTNALHIVICDRQSNAEVFSLGSERDTDSVVPPPYLVIDLADVDTDDSPLFYQIIKIFRNIISTRAPQLAMLQLSFDLNMVKKVGGIDVAARFRSIVGRAFSEALCEKHHLRQTVQVGPDTQINTRSDRAWWTWLEKFEQASIIADLRLVNSKQEETDSVLQTPEQLQGVGAETLLVTSSSIPQDAQGGAESSRRGVTLWISSFFAGAVSAVRKCWARLVQWWNRSR